jgi:hypothetical protein
LFRKSLVLGLAESPVLAIAILVISLAGFIFEKKDETNVITEAST